MASTYQAYDQVTSLRSDIAERIKSIGTLNQKEAVDALRNLDTHAEKIENGKEDDFGIGPLNRELSRLATMVTSGDSRPAAALVENVDKACNGTRKRLSEWESLNKSEVPQVNSILQKSGFPSLPVKSEIPESPACK